MRREVLLIAEMIEAAEEARAVVADADRVAISEGRQCRDALLWNFTVLGGAASQLDEDVKRRFPDVAWEQPARPRNRVVMAIAPSISRSSPPPPRICSPASSRSYGT